MFSREINARERFRERSSGRPIRSIEADELDTLTLVLSGIGTVVVAIDVVVVKVNHIAIIAMIFLLGATSGVCLMLAINW